MWLLLLLNNCYVVVLGDNVAFVHVAFFEEGFEIALDIFFDVVLPIFNVALFEPAVVNNFLLCYVGSQCHYCDYRAREF